MKRYNIIPSWSKTLDIADHEAELARVKALLREIDSTIFALVQSNVGLNWMWPDTARETSLRRMKEHRERIRAALGEGI